MRIVLAIPFILSFFPVMFCAGQKSIGGRIDTFALAKELRNDREYGESVRLMYQYLKAHPGDVNALWYNGQTELWRGRFRKSRSLYQQVLSLRPDDDYLLLDYANTLAVTGKWNQAGDVLDQLRARGVNYSGAYLIRANLAYWGANYEHALRYVDSALALDPANNTARDLQVQIQNTRAPWVELTSAYSTDNQPVQALATSVRAGTFVNRFLIPSLHLEAPLYWRNGMSTGIYKIDIANEMNFSQAGIKVALGAGMAHFESTDANEWTGALAVQQRWGRLGWQMAV